MQLICCYFPLFFSSRGARGHAVVQGKWSFFWSSVSVLVVKNPYDLRSQIRFWILPQTCTPWRYVRREKKKQQQQQQKVEETWERKKFKRELMTNFKVIKFYWTRTEKVSNSHDWACAPGENRYDRFKFLGLLRRSCPFLTKVAVRKSLCLAIVKPHLCYATEVWSPAQKSLKVKVEQVQRHGTRWILSLKPGQMSYGGRLRALDMLPLAYDREIKDLVLFYKAVYGYIDMDVSNYVTLNNHPRTRRAHSAAVILLFRPLRPALCKLHILFVL